MLCVLFNIMLIHDVLPQMFGNGVIVPIVKNKNGDITSLDNNMYSKPRSISSACKNLRGQHPLRAEI